jgi:uncharacterized membrane protein
LVFATYFNRPGPVEINADGSVIAVSSGYRGLTGAYMPVPPPPGATNWTVSGVSANGQTLVGSATTPGGLRPVRWTQAGGHQVLPFPQGVAGVFGAQANGASATGNTVVGYAYNGQSVAVRWVDGIAEVLSGVPAGNSQAVAISGAGDVIAGMAGSSAFVWTDSGLVTLPTIGQAAGFSQVSGISLNGNVIFGNVPGAMAVRWVHGPSGWNAEPMTAGGGVFSPRGSNADGSTIVGMYSTSWGTFAALWTEQYGIVNLNGALAQLGVDLQGGTLISADGISADGSTIYGRWSQSGVTRDWILRGATEGIPAPAAVALFPLAGLAALRRRR